jgi:transposase
VPCCALAYREKKTVSASERNEEARQDWRERAETLPARRIVVIDESSTHLGMTSPYARAPSGKRAYAQQQRNYGKNMTLLAGLRLEGMSAPMLIEGAVNTAVFETFVEQVLLPTLHQGDIVVVDNLSAHKSKRVESLLAAKRCQILFLPAYSPDFSPIENAFAKIKQHLRVAQALTVDALIEALDIALAAISPFDAIGFFTNAGFLNLD